MIKHSIYDLFLNQVQPACGQRAPGFLELLLSVKVCLCVCLRVCVCVPPEAINN